MSYTLEQIIKSKRNGYIVNKNNPEEMDFWILFDFDPDGEENMDPTMVNEIKSKGYVIVDYDAKIVEIDDAPVDGWVHDDQCYCQDCMSGDK